MSPPPRSNLCRVSTLQCTDVIVPAHRSARFHGNVWQEVTGMSSSSSAEPLRLPPLSPAPKAPSPRKSRGDRPLRSHLELPLLPSATKADKYAKLSQFDRSRLKRQKAHIRNALKTTENIQKIAKQLNEVGGHFCTCSLVPYMITHLMCRGCHLLGKMVRARCPLRGWLPTEMPLRPSSSTAESMHPCWIR